jgi:2-polyprenyl-3-methyl-5-hydroxy-6-metoxy-1,4-benzoquinol methylase
MTIETYKKLDSCLACGGTHLLPLLDLGTQPLANDYHDSSVTLPSYPLALQLCPNCFHAQQAVAVNPDLMFKNYLYVSGTSKTLRDYFDWLAERIDTTYGAAFQSPKKMLDIACNDGSELVPFMNLGWEVTAIDPAENLTEQARATGARVVCDYWNKESAHTIGGPFDIVLAQNVFAHVSDPFGFLQALATVVRPGSKVFLQTSQADMISRGEFDTVYHEHISFFSARSMRTLAARAGFVLEDILITPIHGGSYVFVLSLDGSKESITPREHEEDVQGRYRVETHVRFADNARRTVLELKELLETHRKAGRHIVGFGAAAKGNTVLNFGGISLDYIVDDNSLKQGLLTPGMNIPIAPLSRLAGEKGEVVIVPLAWNFFDEIYRKVKTVRADRPDVFVTYFPSIMIRS